MLLLTERNLFTAEETVIDGKQAITLTVRDFRSLPKRINLVLEKALPGHKRFPAIYEYVDVPAGSIFDLRSPSQGALRIVAGPGVSVHLEEWPQVYPTDLLSVYRVQDPDALPPQATTIISTDINAPVCINPPIVLPAPIEQLTPLSYPLDCFILDETNTGILVTHPYSTYALQIAFAKMSHSRTNPVDARSRFCYQVVQQPGNRIFQEPSNFDLVKTPSVSVTLRGGPPLITAFKNVYSKSQYLIPFRVWEVDDITMVPPQGSDLEPGPEWRDRRMKVESNIIDDQTYIPFRIGLSFVPVLGEVLDVAEAILASETGKDFRGRKLSEVDKAVLGLGALFPLLPAAVGPLLKSFGRRARVIDRLRKLLRKAGVTAKERRLLQKAEEAVKNGAKLSNQQAEALQDVLVRMEPEYPPLQSVINSESTGFLHVELQEGYQAYKARQIKAGKHFSSPDEWARANTSGRYSDLLVKLLGQNYRKASVEGASIAVDASRLFNIADIMRPMGFTEARVAEALKTVFAQNALLAERLRPLIRDLASTDQIVARTAREQVTLGRFNNIKGIIGEILALPTQLTLLREAHPQAVLLTGVKLKHAGESAVLFTDNVIAIRKGNNLQLEVVFEVKAGKRGGAEATSQVFEWIEGRIQTGDQLIVPAGSRYYDAQGIKHTLSSEIVATYGVEPSVKEAAAGVGNVTGLANADRKIIAAKGTSQLGLDSPDQVAKKLKKEDRLDLPLSSAEIDFLGGQLIRALGGPDPL